MKTEILQHKMKLTAVYKQGEKGGYVAFIKEIPGAISQGQTIEEARVNLLDALELLLEANHLFILTTPLKKPPLCLDINKLI